MTQRQDVEFVAEGNVVLRGWLVVPDGVGPHPAITMAHGFAGVKERGREPTTTQAVVSSDPATPAAYRSPDAVAFYNQPVPDGVWRYVMTVRSSRAARMYEPGAWISRVSPRC
jgi:hypothetical protein